MIVLANLFDNTNRRVQMDKNDLELLMRNMPAFQPHASYGAAMDCMEVVLEDASLLERQLSSSFVELRSPHDDRFLGFRLIGARGFLNSQSLTSDIGVLALLNLFSKIDSTAVPTLNILMDMAFDCRIPLYFCPRCKTWALFRFEDWNMCDDCTLASLSDEDLDTPLDCA